MAHRLVEDDGQVIRNQGKEQSVLGNIQEQGRTNLDSFTGGQEHGRHAGPGLASLKQP